MVASRDSDVANLDLAVVPPDGTPRLAAPELLDYLLDIGGALLAHGCSTHRLESVIREIAALECYRAEVFAVPTGLFINILVPAPGTPLMRMARVKQWGTDLESLALIDEIFNDVLERKLTLAQARARLDEVEARPPAYGRAARFAAYAGATATAAVLFRGGAREVAVAIVGGVVVFVLQGLLGRWARTRLLQDFFGALVGALLGWGAALAHVTPAREVVVLSVVILLVPGMALTTGLAELAHKNLVSGAAKLMDAMMTFLSIVFGVAIVAGVEALFGGHYAGAAERAAAPLGLQVASLVVASGCFAVIFAVPRRLLPAAMLCAAGGWIVTSVALRKFPGHLAVFAAALVVALLANASARWTKRPSQVFLLPGLVLLVPGGFGFRSLDAFLHGEILGGTARGFEMFLSAGAIVTGLLVANVVLPARKLL